MTEAARVWAELVRGNGSENARCRNAPVGLEAETGRADRRAASSKRSSKRMKTGLTYSARARLSGEGRRGIGGAVTSGQGEALGGGWKQGELGGGTLKGRTKVGAGDSGRRAQRGRSQVGGGLW